MAANKTAWTDADPDAFVAGVADSRQRADAETLIALMSRLSGDPPRMYGPSIVGFGNAHYRYASGREGDMPRIAFSPRNGQTVLYLTDEFPGYARLLARLGKHKASKACLYIKRLSDVDQGVLAGMIEASLAHMDVKYPRG